MEIQRETLVAPNSYTRLAPNGVGGEGGPGNYWVPVSTPSLCAFSPLIVIVSCRRCINRHRTTDQF